ncbi:DUF1934 domain-containing protein [Cohnella nanjingensis]|uniref:DUF1934 domain-containing protein n=1 Tax=Cohnella nanjingensis TaxID=1387779 RepID=A0A7X0RN35_9BACL|nr:DUF1934 domain-containing protein [Cohnella nanjingensis]MBB6670574.1 DUF1934 domain-containing protein [Cohnella nanjingensis]
MPDKRRVTVVFRSRQDGPWAEERLSGEWYRLAAGWVLRVPDTMTVSVLKGDVRVVRQGELGVEQTFRLGAAAQGAIHTPQGSLPVEAFTHELQAELTDAGGTLAWRYDMRMEDQDMGHFEIGLDIREE